MKNKRSRFRVLLALVLALTILVLPLDTLALSTSNNTATPDETLPTQREKDNAPAAVGTGGVVEVNGTEYSTLNEALSAWSSGSTLKLLSDVTTSSTITVPSGEHTLDLNGHGIKMTGSGGVIKIPSDADLTLIDSRAEGNTHYYYIDSATNLAVLASTQEAAQSGNSDKNGSFTGGYLTGGNNPSYDDQGGGGILVLGKLTMNNGTVIGNYVAGAGGGINVCSGGNASITGANIIGNKTGNVGGGVDIPNYANTVVALEQCVIRHNHANSNTGGIAARGGRVTLKDCDVLDNTAQNNTSGLLGQNCHLTVENVSVKGNATANSSTAYTPGLTLRNSNYNNFSFTINGAVTVENNTMAGKADDSIYIHNGRNIAVGGELTYTVPIKIRMQSGKGEFTNGWKANMGSADPSKYFTSDDNNYQVFLNGNGEAEIGVPPAAYVISGETTTSYGSLSDAVNAWTAGSTLKLLSDVTTGSTITVPTGEHTLDLNGHGIKMTGSGSVINVGSGATLNVEDSNPDIEHKFTVANAKSNGAGLATVDDSLTSGYQTFKGGYITGGSARDGGGIKVNGTADLTMNGGTIIGNQSSFMGAGIKADNNGDDANVNITVNGGAVIYNTVNGYGAGICSDGAVRINGGTVAYNVASNYPGGVHSHYLYLNGGRIENNYSGVAEYASGAHADHEVFISGDPVVYNNLTNGDPVNLDWDRTEYQHGHKLNLVGELTEGAKIGVTIRVGGNGVFTSGWKDKMGDADPADYFASDSSDYAIRLLDGEACVGLPDPPDVPDVSAMSFEGLYDGAAHYIEVTAPDGATIKYGTEEGSYTLTENPTYTDAGTYTVYYQVSKENYTSVTGSATVTIHQINATVTITGRSLTVDYDGKAHSADGYDAVSDSDLYDVTKDFTFSGRAEAVRTNAGTTKMNLSADKFKNTNTNFANVTFNVTDGFLTVNPVDAVITTAPHAKSELIYKDSDQELIAAGAADGGTLYYALGDDAKTAPADESYTTAIPTATQIGNYYIWYMVKGDSNHNDLSPTCVKVTMADQGWGTVSGAVVDENHSPVKNTTVSLIMGGRVIDEIASGSDGSYYFTVPAGIYNIVVKSSDATVTEMVNVSDRTTYDLTVPDSDTDSVLDIVDTDGRIVVGGLSKEAAAVRNTEGVSADQNVSVRMTVKTVSESDTTGSQAISGIAGDMFVEYYDCKFEKTVNTVTTSMDKTQTVLELVIPCSYTNKRELTVYNSDGSGAQTLTLSDSREAGTFRVDQNAGLVYIYTDRIATYAVGYKPYYSIKSEVSLGNFSGNVSVKLTKDTTGETYALNNVSLNSISFAGLPKGTYSMTITWTDGAENTLTTPFIIK